MPVKHLAISSRFATERAQRFFEYEERTSAILDDFFFNCFDYLRANALEGSYLEFGCGFLARSFRLAAKYRCMLRPAPHLYAFDTFSGLPSIKPHDSHPGWTQGAMALALEDFDELLQIQGCDSSEYTTIKGLFSDTLKDGPDAFGITNASFVYVDCDLYESTKDVLPFISRCIPDGSILAFDDWNCYRAKTNAGQRRAFSEFCASTSDLSFQPFLPVGWHGQSFIVRKASEH